MGGGSGGARDEEVCRVHCVALLEMIFFQSDTEARPVRLRPETGFKRAADFSGLTLVQLKSVCAGIN